MADNVSKPDLRKKNVIRRRKFSSLTLRLLAPNVLALGVLVAGIFYLDNYRTGLLDARLESLKTEARILAAAVGQSAVTGPLSARRLDQSNSKAIIGRLAHLARVRVHLYDRKSVILIDSRDFDTANRQVHSKYLPPPDPENQLIGFMIDFYDWFLPRLPKKKEFAYYSEPKTGAQAFPEVIKALAGNVGTGVRSMGDGTLIMTVAVPVQELYQVVGVMMLSADSVQIENSVRNVRVGILVIFALALGITVLLSLFLAGTIARPVMRLADAADRARNTWGRRVQIPDLTSRHDEIGDLSASLIEMTKTLYARLDAIEVFAADVAHEIKNPLTSLNSAIETFEATPDARSRAKLLNIMHEDISRLDHLISDISNASRIDAEISRAEVEQIDLVELIYTAVEIYRARMSRSGPIFEVTTSSKNFEIQGVASRLGQVIDNLISNAVTFSPFRGIIRLGLHKDSDRVLLTVDDDGPGIPEGEIEAIFRRFYTSRPSGQIGDRHSGLGLSISRQIIVAHGGTIKALNRLGSANKIVGARFIIELPM